MRNLLAFLMALILTVGGLGYYLDWFKIRTAPGTDGHTSVNIDWNALKFFQDTAKAGAKVTEMLDKKAKDETEKVEADKKAKAEADRVEADKKAKDSADKSQPKLEGSGLE